MTQKTVNLPQDQIRIIRNALKHYQGLIDDNHIKFDCETLSALFLYETRISVPEKNAEHFASLHGIDFPEYLENSVL